MTSQADACIYCMGSKVSSLSPIYLYSSYFDMGQSLDYLNEMSMMNLNKVVGAIATKR
jgi:hypothetical protein